MVFFHTLFFIILILFTGYQPIKQIRDLFEESVKYQNVVRSRYYRKKQFLIWESNTKYYLVFDNREFVVDFNTYKQSDFGDKITLSYLPNSKKIIGKPIIEDGGFKNLVLNEGQGMNMNSN